MSHLTASLATSFPGLADACLPYALAAAGIGAALCLLSWVPALCRAYAHYRGTCDTLSRSTYMRRSDVACIPTQQW